MNYESKYPTTIYRVSLKAVIRDEHSNVLMCKEYDSDSWSLPGGGWDHGETEHAALARELKEEVNYEGHFETKPFATAVFWLEPRKSWLLWIVYDVTTENMNFSVGNDTNEIAFVDPKTLENANERTEHWIFENLC